MRGAFFHLLIYSKCHTYISISSQIDESIYQQISIHSAGGWQRRISYRMFGAGRRVVEANILSNIWCGQAGGRGESGVILNSKQLYIIATLVAKRELL